MSNKSRIFDLMKKGKEKEIEIMGEKFNITAPKLAEIVSHQSVVNDPKSKSIDKLDSMSKIVINCTMDLEGKPYFSKGDLELLKEDRSGIVVLLMDEINNVAMDEETIEEGKKN